MSEQLVPENRNRSRSKTPFHLRSQCDGENCNEVGHIHVPTKKNPTVSTIAEETESSDSKHKSATNDISVQKFIQVQTTVKTTSQVTKNQNAIHASLSSTNLNSPITATTATKVQAISNQSNQRTLLKSKRVLNTETEIKENILNKVHEEINFAKHSTPKGANSSTTKMSPNVLDKLNLNDHLAYKEYKEAGEYWKKYPKTDYTYSSTYSPYRREIKPGVIAMPNMSRKSLDHHENRINEMALNNPAQESYIRSRYQSSYDKFRNFSASDSSADSLDELDVSEYDNRAYIYRSSEVKKSIVSRFVTTIITYIFTAWYKFCRIFSTESDHRNLRYTRLNENRGLFARIISLIQSVFLSIFRSIYLVIATIQFWDSCFLQSSSAGSRGKKRFLIILLLLLPLLFLSGVYHYYEKPLPIPNISSSAFSDYVNNYIYLDNVRDITFNQYENAKNISSDLLIYLKQLCTNSATEMKKVWLENFAGLLSTEDKAAVPAIHTSLPVYVHSIKAFGYNLAQSTRSYFDFDWRLPFMYQSHQNTINNFQQSSLLSDQQYLDLIKHIDSYIERIVSEQSKSPSPEANNILIASIVKENIINYKYQLTLEDIERIANSVRMKLSIDDTITLPLEKHREYIVNVVKENVNLHLSDQTNIDNANDEIKIDKILMKVFASATFLKIIDQEIQNQIGPQLNRFDNLENELQFVNGKLNDKMLKNQDVKDALIIIKTQHDQLHGSLNDMKSDMEIKLENLLKNIDFKFSELNQKSGSTIDNHIKVILMDIMGYETKNGMPAKADLKSWIQNIFVAKEYLEQRLNELSLQFNKNLSDELNRSAAILMGDVGEQIKRQILILMEKNNQKHANGGVGIALDEARIKAIVQRVLAIYDADKTGLVDYALESAGGEVLSTRCTENYRTHYQLSIFGIPIPYNYQSNTPRTAISPTVQPGNCWSFQGFPGFLVIKLNNYVFVSGFTIEHIPKALAPKGKIDSAPKNFTVWGLDNENDHDPIEFGKYMFAENATSLQYFAVDNKDIKRSFNVVELRIESNHGSQNYTCLYRFRVHGEPDT